MQIIRDVLEIFESSEIRDTDLETLSKFVRGCKLNQARCNEKRKLLAAKASLKIEAITSLLKLKELLAIGITVSETNKISYMIDSFFLSFHKLYKENPKHNGTLLHAIQSCLISKANRKTNTKFQIAVGFFFDASYLWKMCLYICYC